MYVHTNTHINTHPPLASSGQAAMEMLLSFPAGAYKRNELESRVGGKEKHSPVILSKAESMYGLGIFSSRNIVSFLLYFSLSLSSSLSLSFLWGSMLFMPVFFYEFRIFRCCNHYRIGQQPPSHIICNSSLSWTGRCLLFLSFFESFAYSVFHEHACCTDDDGTMENPFQLKCENTSFRSV